MTAEEHIQPLEIFYSYAHKDERMRDELAKHLSNLRQQGLITAWHDRDINAGMEWKNSIDAHLNSAAIILLLISSNFMDSEYCYSIEMKRALARHEAQEARVIPIILDHVDWEGAPFEKLQMLPKDAKPVTDWHPRSAGYANVVRGIKKILTEIKQVTPNSATPTAPQSVMPPSIGASSFQLHSSEEPSANTNRETIWYVPSKRNPLFTGREETLQTLHDALTDSKTAALTQAISGLGGIGKTQTALEYAYRYHKEYRAIFWVRAASREELLADFTQIASIVQVSDPNEQDQGRIVAAVKSWFQSNPSWLLIVDNADDLNMVKEYLPIHTGGHILLTTRTQAVRSLAHKVELTTLPPDESVHFLLRRAGVNDTELAQLDAKKRTTAEAIAKELGYLPLALDQAGAYIEETGISLPDYLALYQRERKTLLARRGGLTDDHAPVATTWSLAFDKLAASNPAAIDLIHLCAFLAPDAIAEEMLIQGAHYVSEDLQQAANSQITWDDTIRDLGKYSLLSRQAETKTLSLHRLVQAVLYDEMDVATQKHWANIALQVVYNVFPFDEVAPWIRSQRYISDALMCFEHADQLQIENEEVNYLRHNVAVYFYNRGQYDSAQALLEQVLKSQEPLLGAEHPTTLSIRHNLALLYNNQEKFEQAQVLNEQVLKSQEQVLGLQHPDTLSTRHNLAVLYFKLDKYEQAQDLFEQVLSSFEQLLGLQHPDTLNARHSLAVLYMNQGKARLAQDSFEQVLKCQEQLLRLQHPDTLRTRHNLAGLYWEQGKREQAQILLEQVLHDREQVLGVEHPDTLRTRRALDELYEEQGKDE